MAGKPLSRLERSVLELLLSREEEGYDVLREQLIGVEVTSRDIDSGGFFSELRVSEGSPRAPASVGNPLGEGRTFDHDAYAEIDGMKYGAGFLLWLEGGRMDMLEGYGYAEPWPAEVRRFQVRWEKVNR